MGRAPCCDKANVKKGPWSPEEDSKLKDYIHKYGTGGNWIALPQKAGLRRCGKSCRLRWLNYLRPNLKHGEFTETEDRIICTLFANIGSRWSIIAAQLPGRTDNDIKNYWNTKLKKKLLGMVSPQAQAQRKPHPQPQQTYSSSQLQNLPISLPSLHYNTTDLVQIQEQESLLSPMHYFSAPVHHVTENNINNNLLMLGSDQTSCSSSDGSCSNIKQEDNHQMGFLQSFISNNGFQESHSFKYSSSPSLGFNINNNDQQGNGYFGEISFDNDIEDLKQLISSSNYYDNVFSSNS